MNDLTSNSRISDQSETAVEIVVPKRNHVQWLADCHKAMDAAAAAPDDTPEEVQQLDPAG